MTEPSFGALEGQVLTLFGRGDLDAALEAARAAAARYPDRTGYTAFWEACIHGARGEPKRALASLTDAVERTDVWWGAESCSATIPISAM